jgi:UDP-N-acetyl-D-mannosaminuronic acid dehydrogenase
MIKETKKIVVMGIGYVGLPLALILAKKGFKVVGVDVDREKVKLLRKGKLYIQGENELDRIFHDKKVRANFFAQTEPSEADAFIIAVPTPLEKATKKADLKAVISATKLICPYIRKGNIVIVESTVPPLTARDVVKPILEKNTKLKVGKDIYLVHCPERILPGNILAELIGNDRVIGGYTEEAAKLAESVYKTFVKGNIYLTDDITAELCKLAENSYRDVNIAFANELSQACQGLGVDVDRLISLANRHPRVDILMPGIGVGGHCIPIDPWFIHQVDSRNSTLIRCARNINDTRPHKIAQKIINSVQHLDNPKIALFGLTYKKDVDDPRESPALEIFHILKNKGLEIKAFDPLLKKYRYDSLGKVIKEADAIVFLVAHKKMMDEFREKSMQKLLREKVVLSF